MASTADCTKLIKAEDLSKFTKLITGNKTDWKRVTKFKYKNGSRRYFYLLESCLIATVDEVAGNLSVMVRPPMLWEVDMLQTLRPNDDFLQEEIFDLHDEHYDFATEEAAKGSEPEQYYFQLGEVEEDEGVWMFFNPRKLGDDVYDQHLGGDLYDILPEWLRANEEAECSYSNFGSEEKSLDDIKQELLGLGFTYEKA